jgi:hypothetical protein
MANIFHLSDAMRCDRGSLRAIAGHRRERDIVTAVMLSNGASGGWRMNRALSSAATPEQIGPWLAPSVNASPGNKS